MLDQGTDDAEQWAAKREHWAAVVCGGAWAARYGDTRPHLLVTVPGTTRLLQRAPWLAAGRTASSTSG